MRYELARGSDAALFNRIAEGLFDNPVERRRLAEFLADPRHHIAVAVDDGVIVGFVSAVDYLHPDKPRQLWINEVGVAPPHQGKGIGKRLMQLMLEHARDLGCTEAWVLTDEANAAAKSLYRAAGAEAPGGQLMYSYPLGPGD